MQTLVDKGGDQRWRRDDKGNMYYKAPWGLVKHDKTTVRLFEPFTVVP